MKIKLFKHGVLPDGHYNGIPRTRLETNEELENRINEYMADKKVSNVQAYGDNIMVTYEEVMVIYNLVNESLVLTYSDFTVKVMNVNKIWGLSNK